MRGGGGLSYHYWPCMTVIQKMFYGFKKFALLFPWGVLQNGIIYEQLEGFESVSLTSDPNQKL